MSDTVKLPKHDAMLQITHNEHKDYYQTIHKYMEDRESMGDVTDWESEAMMVKSMETGELWEMRWYPDTPVSSHCVAAPTLSDLLRFAMEEDTK